MPIYEYQCPDCGHKFEKLQKMSDDPITVCPECSGGSVRKLVSSSAFILKGSGWYKDHYGLKKSSGGGDSKGGDAKSAASSASGEAGAKASGGGSSSTASSSTSKSGASSSSSATTSGS